MDEKTVVITEQNGTYQIQNNGIADFTLLGILECIVFDMKSTNCRRSNVEQSTQKAFPAERNDRNREQIENASPPEAVKQKTKREIVEESAAPDVRMRISNAVKAIKALGGNIEEIDLSNLTDQELQSELEELTSQYKRLKSLKASK
jgi:Asp-tRNA(Asn)/Glu-tRNA(Gln) amidotransferase A subunit family amidase